MHIQVNISLDCVDANPAMQDNLRTSLEVFMNDVFQVKNPACVRSYSIEVSEVPAPSSPSAAFPYFPEGTGGSD